MRTATIVLHPKLQERMSPGDLVRLFEARGYALRNTRRGYVEARALRKSIVQSIFDFARRQQ